MKPPHFNEPPFGKKKKRNTQIYKKLAIIIALTLVIVIVIPFFHINKSPPKPSPSYFSSIKSAISNKNCDLSIGEWFPNPSAPYYTRSTCKGIQEHQNCMKYGRPDVGFMQWRWKPDGCDLPIFNPSHFLELMRDKSLAFVGDSLSRNHLQSLICLLTKVESPKDISSFRSEDGFKRYKYRSYNFILAIFWSPHLVKTKMVKANSKDQTHLYLDEFDEKWTTQIDGFDYLIISGGHWFFSPKIFHENNHIVGCHNCLLENVTDLGYFYGYRKAFRTAFKAINNLKNFKGMTILRTFSPSHFENGEWNEGGNCVRKGPFFRNEIQMDGRNLELRKIQMEEFKAAEKEGKKRGLKYRVLDTTQTMLLRPDGHPSKYGHWPSENITMYNDCVHWCLPGPIDSLNDFLLEILKREVSFLTSV